MKIVHNGTKKTLKAKNSTEKKTEQAYATGG